MAVFIDPRICDKEEICELTKVCPRDAIVSRDGAIVIDQEKCTECLLCLKACPYLAVRLVEDLDKPLKVNKGAHILKLYGAKPGRIGKPQLKDANFKKRVGTKPTLVVFWGAHAGVITPFVREIAKKYKGKLRVAYIKIANNPKTRKKYSINTTPTLILFKKGKAVSRLEGVRHKETMRVWVEMNLPKAK